MKKKNLFSLVALATLTLGSCTNDEVVNDYSQDNAIQFGTYVGRDAESRGSVIDTEALQKSEDGFGVFAYYTGSNSYSSGDAFVPNFMNNEVVTYDSQESKWSYSPLKYWPNNATDKVSFMAYAPYDSEYKLTDTGKGLLSFTVAEEVTEQVDLLWSTNQQFNKTKDNIDDVDDKVNFTFGHALSKIGFTISAGVDMLTVGGTLDEATTIYVDKVVITPLYNTGILDLSAGEATWSERSGEATYTWDYVASPKDGEVVELTNNILTSATVFGGEEYEAPSLINENAYLFAIPQTLSKDFAITVTYRVFTEDEKLSDKITEKGDIVGSLVTNEITANLSTIKKFEAGKQYTFNIILGMTSVKVEATVSGWNNGGGEDVWFDENNEDDKTQNP